LRVARYICWKRFEGDSAVKPGILGLIDDTHTPATKFLNDAVVGNRLANHGWEAAWQRMLSRVQEQVNERECYVMFQFEYEE